ncbi:MAG: type III ribulose-bisphosphate carboxylase [Candidatus Aenigmarchaeota archaeon]|nr:type III ribulose-bisphosphate carboxylase [Candidatus Aenigmarchaeota archaeon]
MDFITARYYFETASVSRERAVQQIAAESSIGTWTEIKTLTRKIQKKLSPKIMKISKKNKTVDIAYPSDLFEFGSVPQLMSSLGGNVFGMKLLKNLRLVDIQFPKSYIKSFKGPAFGIGGVRRLIKTKVRPHLGTIVKPKVGLNAKEWATVAYNAWKGGLDFVKDDENLTSMKFCKFEDRVINTLDMADKIKEEEGRNVLYAANITAPMKTMIERADFVKEHGGKCIMVDILSAGWSALQEIRNQNYKMVIHAHRAGHATFTRNKKHGISMYVIAKLSRLIGVDQLHIGTAVGKMEGDKKEIVLIKNMIEYQHVKPSSYLEQQWFNIKPVFAVSSGGVYPSLVPQIVKILGNDIVIQAGGGVHGHPAGTRAGAKAMKQALIASMKKINLKKYAKAHKELKQALDKWG